MALGTTVPMLSPRKAETVLEGKYSVLGTRTPWSPEGRTVRSSKASVLVLGTEPDSSLMTAPVVAMGELSLRGLLLLPALLSLLELGLGECCRSPVGDEVRLLRT